MSIASKENGNAKQQSTQLNSSYFRGKIKQSKPKYVVYNSIYHIIIINLEL